jgi:peptidoglycan/LPS O-acetylase OafA/YrhL
MARGFMTILVLFSHFFAKIANGFPRLGFGWFAVNMFFVLSGFLIGRLIVERKESENFFTVFICAGFAEPFVAVGVGWALTTLIEAPLTAYGRRWKWSAKKTVDGPFQRAAS